MFLEKRLGETKDHKGNNSNGPLCKGIYNSKMGKMVYLQNKTTGQYSKT